MDSNSLYREEILEHYHSPQNFGKPAVFDVSAKQLNPFCGDEIEIYIKFDSFSQGVATKTPPMCKITDIRFKGVGCAISIAGASLITEYAKGKTINELTKFSELDMLSLLGIEISETRKKCALLAYAVLKDCIK